MGWTAITNLGDSAIMAPMALLVAGWLWLSRSLRAALLWSAFFWAGALLVVATKIAYLGWGLGVASVRFTGISGHSMTAAAVLTVAGYFAGEKYSNFAALVGGVLGCSLAVAIAVSRVVLGFHSSSEGMAGWALGCLIAFATIGVVRNQPKAKGGPIVFICALLLLVITLHGARAPTEQLISKFALFLSGRSAPFN